MPMSNTQAGKMSRFDVFRFMLRRRRSLLEAFMGAVEKHGTLIEVGTKKKNFFILAEPAHMRHVLVMNAKNYSKRALHNRLQDVLGEGLFTSEGQFWKRQRQLVQPAYAPIQLLAYAEAIEARTLELTQKLKGYARDGNRFDLYPEMVSFTLDIVMETILGSESKRLHKEVHTAVGTIIENLEQSSYSQRVLELMPALSKIPGLEKRLLAQNPEFIEALDSLNAILMTLVAERREKDDPGTRDVLSLLIKARDEEREGMSDKQLRDELMIAFIAGHETSAVALSWIFSLLTRHPVCASKVKDELARVLGEKPLKVEHFDSLVYTRAVILEALRLYPPIWRLIRTAESEDVIDGRIIPEGATLVLLPFVTHHLEKFWPDPEVFRPERFLDVKLREILSYLPFGAGPRVCIGQNFAMNEMFFAVASVFRNLHFEMDTDVRFDIEPRLSLRPKHPLFVKAKLDRA